ncbi:unnamed protein product [Allacma fusca]|uniref:Uncharacterized protein n=1 Tax=Allacma fusca TaxID=39272 RepID=A0A8J2PCD4_9HEXA|nr:unnamed protein product [Allacma fusca]
MAGNRFKLPQVRGQHDRYCHFCGLQIKAAWTRCESNECRTPRKEPPPVPAGWSLCPTCKIGFIQGQILGVTGKPPGRI